MSKLFKVVGITTLNGSTKVRFANDLSRRVKIFTHPSCNASRCDFVELPSAMTKIDALKHMLTMPEFQSVDDQATINEVLADRSKTAGEVKVKATPSIDSIKKRAKKTDAIAV
jgi:hypothetical protein